MSSCEDDDRLGGGLADHIVPLELALGLFEGTGAGMMASEERNCFLCCFMSLVR